MNAAWREAQKTCLDDVISQPPPDDGQPYCNATWDGWGCWNYTRAGSRAYQQCPDYMPGFDSALHAYRDCTHSATWWISPSNTTWSNYTTCINMADLQKDTRIIHIFVAGYSLSMVLLLISLSVFVFFRQLKCDRIRIHKNLFLSYILNGIAWILYYSLTAMNAGVLVRNPIWCRMIHVITQYFVACNFFWMFCEGLYLHTVVVVAFTTGKRLLVACYLIGWVLPIVPVVAYTAIRARNDDESERCWLEESDLQWIVFGPIVITTLMNLTFLCNIVRVLVTKLRAIDSPNTNQTKKAARATLILIPLLGLQYIIFPLRPNKGNPFEELYLIASAVVTSLQGTFVALIFCFFNGEVTTLMKRKWRQHRLMTGMSVGRQTGLYTQSVTVADNTSIQRPRSPRRNSAATPKSAAGKGLLSAASQGQTAADQPPDEAHVGQSFL